MRSRTLLWVAAGLGGAAVVALVLAGLAPQASPAQSSLQAKSPEALAQEALERELNRTLEKVGIEEIEQLLLSAR